MLNGMPTIVLPSFLERDFDLCSLNLAVWCGIDASTIDRGLHCTSKRIHGNNLPKITRNALCENWAVLNLNFGIVSNQ